MGQNLTGQTIASTYEDLVQISGSILTDGTGSNINNLTVTSSFATTASFALNVTPINTGSFVTTASISNATTTYTKGDGSTFALVTNNVQNASTASIATSASFATTASFALNVIPSTPAGLVSGSGPKSLISANYQPTASVASGTGSIAIGNNVQVDSTNQFALGTNITSSAGGNTNTIVIGANNTLSGNVTDSIVIGNNLNMQNGKSQLVYIGSQPAQEFANQESVVVGYDAGGALAVVAVGHSAGANNNGVAVGRSAAAGGDSAVAVGKSTSATGNNAIAIGVNQTTANTNEINIGGRFRFNSGSLGFIQLSGSILNPVVTGSLTVSGSSTFLQSTVLSGSIRGEVNALSIASNTASLDCTLDNFFTLQLVSGSNTFINPSNILPGQTINLRVNTTGSATVSFPSSVKQVSGSAYVPTTTTGVDVVTFISFDASSLLLSNVKNLV